VLIIDHRVLRLKVSKDCTFSAAKMQKQDVHSTWRDDLPELLSQSLNTDAILTEDAAIQTLKQREIATQTVKAAPTEFPPVSPDLLPFVAR
jgi:hypothetical protein